jgi:hypothetical protein
LFKALGCEMRTLSIAIQVFIGKMDKIIWIDKSLKDNKDFIQYNFYTIEHNSRDIWI